MSPGEMAEKQCWIGVVMALLLITIAGTVLVYRTDAAATEAQDPPAVVASTE